MKYSCSIIYLHRTLSVPNSEAKKPNNLSIDRESVSRIDFNTISKQRRCSETQGFSPEQCFQSETFSDTLVLRDKSISVPWYRQNPSNPTGAPPGAKCQKKCFRFNSFSTI